MCVICKFIFTLNPDVSLSLLLLDLYIHRDKCSLPNIFSFFFLKKAHFEKTCPPVLRLSRDRQSTKSLCMPYSYCCEINANNFSCFSNVSWLVRQNYKFNTSSNSFNVTMIWLGSFSYFISNDLLWIICMIYLPLGNTRYSPMVYCLLIFLI